MTLRHPVLKLAPFSLWKEGGKGKRAKRNCLDVVIGATWPYTPLHRNPPLYKELLESAHRSLSPKKQVGKKKEIKILSPPPQKKEPSCCSHRGAKWPCTQPYRNQLLCIFPLLSWWACVCTVTCMCVCVCVWERECVCCAGVVCVCDSVSISVCLRMCLSSFVWGGHV